MSSNGNGTNGTKNNLLLWASGAILMPLVLMGSANLFNTTYSSTQRIASLEARFEEIQRNLARIERKLDRLTEGP